MPGERYRQGAIWRTLRDDGPQTVVGLSDRFGVSVMVIQWALRRMELAGCAKRAGRSQVASGRTSRVWQTVGTVEPVDHRGGKREYAICRRPTDSVPVIQCRRTGTPSEIARIPSLAELLAR